MNIARIWPWACAFLLGALAPAVIVTCFMGIAAFPLAFAITLGHAIILGLPVALFYRAKQWTRLEATLAGSFLIGAAPAGIVNWPTDFSPATRTSIPGIPDVSAVEGWIQYAEALAFFGGFGAVGGLVFWITLKRFGVLRKIDPVT
jgi:hypothetical protein